jgi:hypothetical protein
MKPVFFFVIASATLSASIRADVVNFDDVRPGALPAGWVAGATGGGNPKWTVEREVSAPSPPNVLKQSGEGKFPWCVKTNVSLLDGRIEVKFKPISGKEDQAGGLIWRWLDGDNYYVARANALEDNVTIYYTLKGVRHERGRASMKVASNEWHTLAVEFRGSHFTVFLDGKKGLEWEDDTFKNAGAVGVWTKADSVTLFDNFSFEDKK